MKKHVLIILFILPLCFLAEQSKGEEMQWISSDQSVMEVNLGPWAIFYWKNPDGTVIFLTGGATGSHLKFTDNKDKHGKINLTLAGITNAMNPQYGMNGEPPIPFDGMIEGGTGTFTLELSGFTNITDVIFTFNAVLVSNGNDNPLFANVYGQGDQLAFPTPGTISFISKWTSSDILTLSNGQQLIMGNFYLNSYGAPSAFVYSISIPNLVADFTIGESYLFVYDLSQDPSGANLRFQLDGSVTKHLEGIYAGDIPTLSQWGLIVFGLLLISTGILFIRKRQLRMATCNVSVETNKQALYNRKIFIKTLAYILPAAIAFMIILNFFTGDLTRVDIAGTLLCSVIAAFILHSMFLMKH